jgi:hypothetical protein
LKLKRVSKDLGGSTPTEFIPILDPGGDYEEYNSLECDDV